MLVVLRYYILVSKAVGSTYPQTLLLVFGLGFAISGVIFFILGILKQRKNLISKEDRDIWE